MIFRMMQDNYTSPYSSPLEVIVGDGINGLIILCPKYPLNLNLYFVKS